MTRLQRRSVPNTSTLWFAKRHIEMARFYFEDVKNDAFVKNSKQDVKMLIKTINNDKARGGCETEL